MCGRYTLFKEQQDLAERYNLATHSVGINDNFNVAPGHYMPIITKDNQGTKISIMKWGLVPKWAKDPKIGYRLINARAETLLEKPAWKNLALKQRCLVPFSGFYEWLKDNQEQKQPYYIKPKQEQFGIASFAGVWETHKDNSGKDWHTYSIITTSPNKEMSSIHDRMPVILNQSDESAWLEPSLDNPKDIQAFLHPYEDNSLQIYQVSKDVNSPRLNHKELIYALNE